MRVAITLEDLLDLDPGEVISAQRPGGIEHFGILTGRHLYGMSPSLISGQKIRQAVVEENPFRFSRGAPLYAHGIWSEQPWQQTIWNARSQLGKPYRLFSGNCEHFVRFCHGLPQESPQLQTGICGAIVGGLIVYAALAA